MPRAEDQHLLFNMGYRLATSRSPKLKLLSPGISLPVAPLLLDHESSAHCPQYFAEGFHSKHWSMGHTTGLPYQRVRGPGRGACERANKKKTRAVTSRPPCKIRSGNRTGIVPRHVAAPSNTLRCSERRLAHALVDTDERLLVAFGPTLGFVAPIRTW